ncbi:UNVERIFIED_CONTAM: hypothetical protein Sangu_2182300 [Sesamum angustifolium]|uniref:Uncharacterized protein n=1 Tax=Sesamum angustifolium TaxID=2727405 RepID=A0AAW2LGX6_9LAMI
MAGWSAENATNAYLRAMKMAKRAKEPDSAEFISALVAGNNARLIVVACADAADSTALALVAAAHQTGGRVVCIVSGLMSSNYQKKLCQKVLMILNLSLGMLRILLQVSTMKLIA